MSRLRFLFALAAIACNGYGQSGAAASAPVPDALRATHNALFSSFLPVEEPKYDRQLSSLMSGAREGVWLSANQAKGFRDLLAPFADLRGFGEACGMSAYLQSAGLTSFAALDSVQREHVLFLLQSCNQNEPRRLAMTVRNFYIVKAYGAIQEPLTGVTLNLEAPHDWIAQHRPHLPPTRLHFVRENHEIVSTNGPIDYLIVGSGPAGSVLAHELRRGGKNVVILERGSFIVPGSMQTRLIDDLVDTRSTEDGAIRIKNGMAVGGGSQVNVDLCFAPTLPAIQAKIESWRRQGRIGENEFTKAQLAEAYEWVKVAIGTRSLSESEINPNNHVLWDGARREGLHPKLYDLNTYLPGKSPYPVTDKRSSESQLILNALQDGQNPLGMVPDADVRKVLFNNDGNSRRAVGVEIRMRTPIAEDGVIADPNQLGLAPGDSAIIHARNVILSAGALGSPVILLRSGIENAQIGRGVILHPSMPILGKFDHTIDALNGTQASVYDDDRLIDSGYALESMSAEPAYAALMSPGPPEHAYQMIRSFRSLGGFGVMLVDTPSSSNRLYLDVNGEARIQYTLSEPDKKRFRLGIAEAVRVMFQAGAKEVYLPTTEDILGRGTSSQLVPAVLTNIEEAHLVEKNLQFIPNRSILTSAHMQATDKMGSDPNDSVVAHDFHVWGTLGLYVVDGSIFPTSIGANPMQSIYTFAKIFADRMLKDANAVSSKVLDGATVH
jgi:choline dehydrogenase-like flavoprotein